MSDYRDWIIIDLTILRWEFEEWYKDTRFTMFGETLSQLRFDYKEDEYLDPDAQAHWEVWQGCFKFYKLRELERTEKNGIVQEETGCS